MIAGGGTGGHLFPGIAVAEAARRRDPAVAIVFVGSERGIEARVVPASGFSLETLPVTPLRGRGAVDKLATLRALLAGVLRARGVIRRFAPDVLIGLGGYASAPAVVAGRLAATPIVLLEQNASPGLTTRYLARLADRVCVSFPETAAHFAPGKAVITGNPVRWPGGVTAASPGPLTPSSPGPGAATSLEPVTAGPATPPPAAGAPCGDRFTILVFGGSAGAQRLNEAGPAMRAALADLGDLRILHQSGPAAATEVRAAYAAIDPRVEVQGFITDMQAAYAAADLVICRAGATTVAELATLGKPAILVPYPHAADDHQRANAESLVRAGAAVMVLDGEATGERLAAEVRRLRADRGLLAAMGTRARTLSIPDAAERVLETAVALVRQRRPQQRSW
jgi:UDP-N-acetylglucosamine--N-acetylmuramyl-(pentapeptide) pyrophosphoryl-undecaprenol N-acetylglucosamine transferase